MTCASSRSRIVSPNSGWIEHAPTTQHVGPQRLDLRDGLGADERLRRPVQPAAEHDHVDVGEVAQRDRDVGAGRDDGGVELGREPVGELERGRPAADGHHLAGLHGPGAERADDRLAARVLLRAVHEAALAGRGAHRSAVDAPELPGGLELEQVAAHRVHGDAEPVSELRGHDRAALGEGAEDRVVAGRSKHDRCILQQDHARKQQNAR